MKKNVLAFGILLTLLSCGKEKKEEVVVVEPTVEYAVFGDSIAADGAISNVEMMGMSGRNMKILLDGVPLVDRSDLKEGLNQIDINTVERIEIVEGPMSVVYGTDALAGVINIITKKGDFW